MKNFKKIVKSVLELENVEVFEIMRNRGEEWAVLTGQPLTAIEALRDSGFDADLSENDRSWVIFYRGVNSYVGMF